MSVGPAASIAASLSGVPVAQRAPQAEQTTQERVGQQRQIQSGEKAEAAAGIGSTDEDQGIDERDADGRRLWEETSGKEHQPHAEESAPEPPSQGRDPSGTAGSLLDLSG